MSGGSADFKSTIVDVPVICRYSFRSDVSPQERRYSDLKRPTLTGHYFFVDCITANSCRTFHFLSPEYGNIFFNSTCSQIRFITSVHHTEMLTLNHTRNIFHYKDYFNNFTVHNLCLNDTSRSTEYYTFFIKKINPANPNRNTSA